MFQKNKKSLAAWMHEENVTNEDMAKRVGCSAKCICKWRTGGVPKALKIAMNIEAETKNVVDLEQLVLHHRKKKNKDQYEQQDE